MMESRKIEFPGAIGNNLAARLDLPAEPRAYALFAHCFTCGKDIFAASQIAEALSARGIAVLRFDFTGIGGSEGEFAYAGATGLKQYIDADIPAGTQQVQYQVRGIRPTAAGAWAQYNVNFGKSSATGAMMASGVETAAEPKIAA